jgi:hypothetical protein
MFSIAKIQSAALLMLATVALLSLSACSWVTPLPGAFKVALFDANQVTECKKMGTTHTSVLDRIGFYERDTEAMTEDLVMLAKNEAVRMRGDTIVALGPVQNGQMDFAIYRCLR